MSLLSVYKRFNGNFSNHPLSRYPKSKDKLYTERIKDICSTYSKQASIQEGSFPYDRHHILFALNIFLRTSSNYELVDRINATHHDFDEIFKSIIEND